MPETSAPGSISVAEAARRAGITRPAIDRHVKAGRIARAGKELDESSFATWLAARRADEPVQQGATARSEEPEDADDLTQDMAEAFRRLGLNGVYTTVAEAERHLKSYQAGLRKIEYDRESASVTDNAEAAKIYGSECAALRTRLLAIPAEWSPRLFACKTLPELQDMLHALIVRALEALAHDRHEPG